MILFLHLFFYYFLIYNIYVFIFLNILYFAMYSVNKHVKNNNIKSSDNMFIKLFIPSDKPSSNYLYYLDIRLSKFKLYEHCKDYYLNISNQFTDFCTLTITSMEQNAKEIAFTAMAPTPQDMMKMIPMMLAQKNNRPMQRRSVQPTNPLLYDSDNDEPNIDDLAVD